MQRCPSCGAPNSAPTCWHCGHQAATADHQPAAEAATPALDTDSPSVPLETLAPAIQPRGMSNGLWIGVAATLFIALSVVIAAGRLSRPTAAEPATASHMAPMRSPEPTAAPLVEPTLLPAWVGSRQAGWGPDGTKTVSFAMDAITDVTASSRTQPQLVARCLSRVIEVYVVTGPLSFERQTGSHTVRVRVDDDPEESQQWVDSQGSQELFAPDGGLMTDRLARAHRLRVGFTPFNAKPVTAEFIVEGFDQLAPIVARTCGKRPSR